MAEKGFTFEDARNSCKYFVDRYKGVPIAMDFVEYGDQKAGWAYKELPDGSDWAVHNKKSVNGTPIGSKLIYDHFECGSNTLKVNLFFMKDPVGGSAFILFRYIRVEKGDDELIEN